MLFQRIPLPETVLEYFQPTETDGIKKETESGLMFKDRYPMLLFGDPHSSVEGQDRSKTKQEIKGQN